MIRGLLLWLVLFFCWSLLLLGIEYFLWLGSTGRMILFLLLLAGSVVLFLRYILWPLLYLLGLKRDLNDQQAAQIIGNAFPEVGDRLRNLLDLSQNPKKSELLIASIEQRSQQLKPFEFDKAVKFQTLKPYVLALIIPLVIILSLWGIGIVEDWFDSYKRVVAFNEEFERPAPFEFIIDQEHLEVLQGKPVTVTVRTRGDAVPETMDLLWKGASLPMKKTGPATFTYTFTPPLSEGVFQFTAGGFFSRNYQLWVREVPVILDFEMRIKEPAYLGGRDRRIEGSGNAVVPEGSQILWEARVENADALRFHEADTVQEFEGSDDTFTLQRKLFTDLSYGLSTSNRWASEYERLNYNIRVIPDKYPEIEVTPIADSLDTDILYFEGVLRDDYGLNELNVLLKSSDASAATQQVKLMEPESASQEFFYTFPSGLQLEEGKNYTVWFEVIDNDGIRGGKVSKSREFTFYSLDRGQKTERALNQQREKIGKLEKQLENSQKNQEALEEFRKQSLQSEKLGYKETDQLKQLLREQAERQDMMRRFSGAMKELMEDTKEDPLLKERLERLEKEAEENAKLLKELQELGDKIKKEELQKRLEDMAKGQSKNSRDLKQLLELTKRYYVQEKMKQLADSYKELAEEQGKLSEKTDQDANEQERLNEETKALNEALEELRKDNEDLAKPFGLEDTKGLRKETESLQENASEALKKGITPKANESQSKAAKNLEELSKGLQAGANSSGGQEAMQEDAEALRQILDNLVLFSFKQERLLEDLTEELGEYEPLGEQVRDQQELKDLFEHVDDSLFALSLRRPELSELVNTQITEVYYNIDKAQASLAEGQRYQGASYQQYVLTAANTLADFLAELLANMQQQLQMGGGEGNSGDFQLPDIIQSQEQLGQKMSGKGSEQGNKGSESAGERGQEGSQGQEGNQGEEGSEGNGGNEGNGQKGESGDGQGEGNESNEGNQQGSQGSELGYGELYEIYMEQQRIRQMLEEQLENMIQAEDKNMAQRLIRQMQQFERELIESGVNQRTLARMDHIRQQLWKLEDAALEQGEEEQRESTTSERMFQAPILTKPVDKEKISSEMEELQRQVLPLRREIQELVKKYFQPND